MTLRKLLLINPVDPGGIGLTVNPSFRYQPLGLALIAALTPGGWEVEVADENFGPLGEPGPADLVGLTAVTATATRAYEIAGRYRARGTPVVMGGIHASLMPEEALEHVDAVVCGEAESVWAELVRDLEAGRLQRLYRGERRELGGMVRPRRDVLDPAYRIGSIQTSRGCPFDCDFCTVSRFNGPGYRLRPVGEVIEELETIPQGIVNFVDDNLVGYGPHAEGRALELFEGIRARGVRKAWFCNASVNFSHNERVLAAAARSGCKLALLGVEAESVAALEEMNKGANLKATVASYEEGFRRMHRHGILVLAGFVFGLDSDTPEALRRRTDFILRSSVDVVQMTALTPLPGTRLYERLSAQSRILRCDYPRDWARYNMTEVVHRPGSMSPEELTELVLESAARIYSLKAIWRRFARTLGATRRPVAALTALKANLDVRAVAKQVIARGRRDGAVV